MYSWSGIFREYNFNSDSICYAEHVMVMHISLSRECLFIRKSSLPYPTEVLLFSWRCKCARTNSYSSMSSTKLDGLSEKSRTLSANTLRDRLSKLTTPLNVVNPVAALHIKWGSFFLSAHYHLSYQIELFFFLHLHLQLCSKFRPSTDTEEKETSDACGRDVVCDDSYNDLCMAPVMVCRSLCAFPSGFVLCRLRNSRVDTWMTTSQIDDIICLVPFHLYGRS